MPSALLRHILHPSFLIIHLALAFAGGIILAHFTGNIDQRLLWLLTSAMLLIILATYPAQNNWCHSSTIFLFFITGLLHGTISLYPQHPPDHLINHLSPSKPLTIIATVSRAAEIGPLKSRLIIETEQLIFPTQPSTPPSTKPHLQSRPISGRVRVSLAGTTHTRPGDRVILHGFFNTPRGFLNPGSYDIKRKLALDTIHITAWVSNPNHIIILTDKKNNRHWRYQAEDIRATIITFLEEHQPPLQSSLFKALLTGDRASLSPQTREAFQRLGIAHLLAISGLHMALLAAGFYATISFLLKRSKSILLYLPADKITAGLTIIPLFFYCLISGFQPPAVRAFIMISVFLLAKIRDGQWHGPTNIALAALIILLINPLDIFSISFQLSFVAVIGIALILPKLQTLFTPQHPINLLRFLANWTSGALAVSVAASLATLPLVLFYFQRTSLIGTVATLLFEPLFCIWSLGWGLLAIPAIFVWPGLAEALLSIGGIGLSMSHKLALTMGSWSWISYWSGPPSLPVIMLFYVGILTLFYGTKLLRLAGLTACLPLFIPWPHSLNHDQITILDVGKGNCAIIELCSGKTIIVDGGGPQSPTFDIGRQVIAPYLRSQHIHHLDLVISSHADSDHYSGLFFLLKHFPTSALWVADKKNQDPGFKGLLELAENRHIPVIMPLAGSFYPKMGQKQIQLLSSLHQTNQAVDDNDQSLVISFTSGPFSFLLPGDIGAIGEQNLNQTLQPHTVVIAPHHGSAASNSETFIATASPQITIFSSSHYNKGLFPANAVVERYQKWGSTMLNTGKQGAIRFIINADILHTLSFQQDQQQFLPINNLVLKDIPEQSKNIH